METGRIPIGRATSAKATEMRARARQRRGALLDALAVPDFRRLWIGSLVSNVGSWMQIIGTGWLVLQLTNSPFWLGMVSFASAVPILAFSLLAGVVADRVDRCRLLKVTQASAGAVALALAALTTLHRVDIAAILALTFLAGTAMAFNMPTWQATIPDLVGRERLMSAVGLNSAAYNGGAVIGPALAGTVIGASGVAACFYLNALSYAAVLWALWRICTPCIGADCASTVRESIAGAFAFIRRMRLVFVLLWLATIASLLARPYLQLMPVFARTVLGGGPRTYGLLMAANGAGALAGALATAGLAGVKRRGLLLLGSMAAFGTALAVFATSHRLALSLGALALAGAGTTLYMGATNTLLQTHVPDAVRGRLMSVYSLIAAGVMPLGGLLLGSAASITRNVSLVVAAGGAIVLANALVMAVGAPALRRMG